MRQLSSMGWLFIHFPDVSSVVLKTRVLNNRIVVAINFINSVSKAKYVMARNATKLFV